MDNLILILTLFYLTIIMLGCNNWGMSISRQTRVFFENGYALTELHRVKPRSIEGRPVTYVYGDLWVYNTSGDTIRYNISKYRLVGQGYTSTPTYINSVATVMLKDKLLPPKDSVHYSVYWVFERGVQRGQLEELTLVVSSPVTKGTPTVTH